METEPCLSKHASTSTTPSPSVPELPTHHVTRDKNAIKKTTFLPIQKVRAKFLNLFRREQHPGLQSASSLFSLPLEIRLEIYLYVFASSMIHEPTYKPLSTFDSLQLTCRQAKVEMESLPVVPVISIVQAHWNNYYPLNPLHISATVDNNHVSEMIVGIPRSLFQADHQCEIPFYIPFFISPLFRIFTDTLTLKILDDGSPLIDDTWDIVVVYLYRQIQSIVWSREHRRIVRSHIWPPLKPSPSRNFLNTKKLIVTWEGALDGEVEMWPIWRFWYRNCDQAFFYPFRRRIGLSAKKRTGGWSEEGNFHVHTITWESGTRFRRR
jgi:hypothetical protein